MLSMSLFRVENDGIEELSVRSALTKSLGNVMFCNDDKLGTVIWGGVMFPNGFTLLMPEIAV
jgi:hypothetical protein